MNKKTKPSVSLRDVLGSPLGKEEVRRLLEESPEVNERFQDFPEKHRQDILEFLAGNRCLKVTYDPFFHHIFHPRLHPERLEDFLSLLLQQKVKIIGVLPREGKRISADSSLVIMDILLQLEDGSYCNIEIQRYGYAFPGERACSYAADMILRQYDMLKAEKGKLFSYHDMRPVHVIILMEESSSAFTKVSPHYIHRRKVSYDSGAQVAELSKITYISLDTFQKVVQNNIMDRLQAWLTFLSVRDAEAVIGLITKYPDFLPLYQEIAAYRKHPKELINMYSEALAIMDYNTELYMIEEAKKEVASLQEEIADKKAELADTKAELADKDAELADKDAELADKDAELADKDAEIARLKQLLAAKSTT